MAARLAVSVIVCLLMVACRAPVGLAPSSVAEQMRLGQRSAVTGRELSPWTKRLLEAEGLPPFATPEAARRLLDLLDERPLGSYLVALAEVSYAVGMRLPRGSEDASAYLATAAIATWTVLFTRGHDVTEFEWRWVLAGKLHAAALAQLVDGAEEIAGVDSLVVTRPLVDGREVTFHVQWMAEAWSTAPFVRIEAADRYEVRGMRNRHRQSGIGAPLVAFRADDDPASGPPAERHLPPSHHVVAMSAIVTGVEFDPMQRWRPTTARVEIHDPNRVARVTINGREAPLHADFTTALAGMLTRDRLVWRVGVGGLRDVESWERLTGIYMLEPFDPDRIPVIFVHGLVSSPATWREIINDLWIDPDVRARFQFWFYMYPTGNPWLYSAGRFRAEIDALLDLHDPERASPELGRMVVVGHSMGGLLTRRLVTDPGERLWEAFSSAPFEEVRIDDAARDRVYAAFFAPAHPAIERAVFIAVPHRGSRIADGSIGRLGSRLVRLPERLIAQVQHHFEQNPTLETASLPRRRLVSTGIDSLSPRAPIIRAMADLPLNERVVAHSIIGRRRGEGPGGSDGVVPYSSSHLPGVESELVISGADHGVPMHPAAAIELRRILREHVANGESRRGG